MNYLTEILAFNDLIQVKQLATGQIALWYALMYINNKCGWQEWFTVSNLTLQLQTGLSRDGINKSRNILKQNGLLDFKQNTTKATSYKLNTMSKFIQVSSQVSIQDSSQVGSQVSSQISSALNKQNKTKQNKNKESKKDVRTFDAIIDEYTENETLRYELKEHLKTRKAKKATLTNRAIQLSCETLDELAKDDETKIAIVKQSIARGWIGFFELKDNSCVNQPRQYINPNQMTEEQKMADRERQKKMLQEAIDRGDFDVKHGRHV